LVKNEYSPLFSEIENASIKRFNNFSKIFASFVPDSYLGYGRFVLNCSSKNEILIFKTIKMRLIILFLLSSQLLFAQKIVRLASPDGAIQYNFQMTTQAPTYTVSFQGQPVISDSKLSLDFKNGAFDKNFRIKKIRYKKADETYELVVGKAKTVRNHYQEAVVELVSNSKPKRQINLIIRAYNDGIAFRYEFPKQANWSSYELTDEHSTFQFASNPTVNTLYLPNYKTSHEGLYTTTKLDSIPANQLMDMPTLFQISDKCYISITEAALLNYAGMYLTRTEGRTLTSKLSPLPNQTELKVKATLPHHTPWRVIMIANNVGKLMESNILTNLNEPSNIKDWSWLKPGKATWTWWNGGVLKDVDFYVGQNFETHKHYIDFCAANNIEFHSIVEYWDTAWYYGEGKGFDPPPLNADVTRPVESLEMERIVEYSKQKGVGLRVWVHWKPLAEKLEAAFAQYEKWNIKGLMIDFMDRDDQEMVNWVEKVLQLAAKYHLHVQFHGAYKPTGLSRMYPNEFTKEGALNLENLKWGKECDPEHNLMIPFTRMIAGPTDYHPGGFRAVTKEDYKANFSEPNVMGTRCHHLGMYVVFESYLQMVCDYPEAYKDQPGFEFLQQVPTSWDETRVLQAQIGNYITIARRKGADWYIGTMNDWTPRTLLIPLDFLSEGTFEATLFSDADDADTNPNHLVKETRIVKKSDILNVKLATGGGQAVWIKRP